MNPIENSIVQGKEATDRWMPIGEYEAMKKLDEMLDLEAKNRMSYYMWNNFSMEGYEEWKDKQNKIQNNG